ncbi:hypothetical protein L2D01_09895 [Hyphomonadaceae bacterium ML37]|nr:hypothetical protein L2D01_09895 [Hyphomonadaceae bacterium ML37]
MALNILRDPPAALRTLMAGFHQDFMYDVEHAASFEAAIARMPAEWLDAEDQERLRPVLRTLLDRASPSDLKGVLRRSDAGYFFKAAAARRIFELWAEALGA